MSTQIDSVNLFKRFTHVQENVPVNLLLFGAPAGGKMSFSHGYVHAPVNDEQSILIALNPEIADYAADGLPSDCYDADTYYRDLLADTLVGFETHYISSLDTNPIISLNKVKDTPVHTVNLAEAYPELHDTLMKDHSAGLDCYVVQCTGNVTTPSVSVNCMECPAQTRTSSHRALTALSAGSAGTPLKKVKLCTSPAALATPCEYPASSSVYAPGLPYLLPAKI